MTVTAATQLVAHHALLLALPALAPAVVLVAVIIIVAVRDRRRGDSADGRK